MANDRSRRHVNSSVPGNANSEEAVRLLYRENSGRSSSAAKSDVEETFSFRRTLRFCLPFIIPDTPFLRFIGGLSIVCITGYKACLLIPGLSMKIAVDALASSDSHIREKTPMFAMMLYLAGRIGGAVFSQGQEVSQEYCAQKMSRRFAIHSFAHLQSLSLTYHTCRKTGEITSILGRGIGSINSLMRLIVFSLLPTIVEAFVVSAIFFKLGSPLIAIITVITVILYIAFTAYITRWRVSFGRDIREAQNKAWSRATESILHYSTVKSFGMDEEEVRRYDSLWAVVQRTSFKAKGVITAFNVSSNFIVQFGTFLGLLVAAYGASHGRLSPGEFILVQSYIGQLFGPLLWMGNSYGQIVSALTNIEQVMQLFDILPDIVDAPDAATLLTDNDDTIGDRNIPFVPVGDIEFRDVTYLYDESDPLTSGGVRNVSFYLPAGKMVALVGPSGAGKSTIVRLLLRLYDVQSGQILINGVDIRKLTQTSLRKAIGLVAQETILFHDTLRNNINYGKPLASDMEIWNAVRNASLEDFVKNQNELLDTVVGEQGTRLSGGERQRVGIARAVLKDPAIMVLDESTSALSTIDERKIQRNLRMVCDNRTTVAVAHRLSTVMMADEILVFDKGQIRERGKHADLVAINGMYARMWKVQSGEE